MLSSSSTPTYADAVTTSASCGCPACRGTFGGDVLGKIVRDAAAGTHANVRGAELLDQTLNADGTYSFSGDDNVDAVLIGSRWTSNHLTFTFPDDGSYDGTTKGDLLLPFTEAQRDAARDAFRLISGYTNLVITEVAPDTAQPTFRLAQTASFEVGSAQGAFPDFIDGEGGEIWFGRTEQPYYISPEKGNWGYSTILHEIGHTMGLKHGMDDYTNVNIGEILGDGSTRFGSVAIEYDKDGQAWSLMTYTPAPNSTGSFEGDGQNQPQSYMQLDIAAMQYLYGANYSTNAGDTVYRWDATSGEGFINDVGQGAPAGNTVFETIWDGGGVDTYDFGDRSGDMSIDLRAGGFTTFSREQLVNSGALTGEMLPALGNIANALLYEGNAASLIENAVAGGGDDVIVGNQVANLLYGGAGDDLLVGGAGSDTLIGALGNDVADFAGATVGIFVTIASSGAVQVANGGDVDTLVDVEGVSGTAFDDILVGDGAANRLSGGAGGFDRLTGGDGDDVLTGAGYQLARRDVPDVARDAETFNKSLATAVALDGSFDLVPRAQISTEVAYPGAVLPHATVVAAGSQQGGDDYYSFHATAGARALFDIDATTNYTGLEMLDASGNVIAANYGVFTTDDGSRSGFDARLAFTFQADGTYYVRVTGSTFDQQPVTLDAFQPYTLQVSLEDAAVEAPTLRDTGAGIFDGGVGSDWIVATAGDDRIEGGAGVDTLSYANHYQGVTVTLRVADAQATGAGFDLISGIENLVGSTQDDQLSGDAGDNVVDGGGGSDVLVGDRGVDTLSFASQADGVTASLALQGRVQEYRLGRDVLATGFENLTGSQGSDVLTGDRQGNVLSGLAGDDVLAVGGAPAAGAIDRLDGGDGTDVASFAGIDTGVRVALDAVGGGSAASAGVRVALLSGIENLIGGGGGDRLVGNRTGNALTGGTGADRLFGADGDDVLDGGNGDDLLAGGTGVDTAVFAGERGATVDLAVGRQDTGYGTDRLVGIENLRGGDGNDALSGDAHDNVFFDTAGSDRYVGRGGSDTVDYSFHAGLLAIDLTLTAEQPVGDDADTLLGIENLVGGDNGNLFSGSADANRLTGGAGGDILIGREGADGLTGGDGDDFLTGDEFELSAGAGADVLSGGRGFDTLIGGAGDDVLSGGDGNDFISTGTFASSLDGTSWTRGTLIRADGGNDTIDGGEGEDLAVLAYNGRADDVRVDIRDPDATAAILSGGVAVGTITSVERLGFEGGEGDDVVFAGAGYDYLAGNGGNDFIDAGLGDDNVYYTSGNDRLEGGEGVDTLNFADASRGITYDIVAGTGNAGEDGTLIATGFETVFSSAFGDTIHFGKWNDGIYDTGVGRDRFYGRQGDDNFTVVRTVGQASAIVLAGGTGNDTLTFEGDRVDAAGNPLAVDRVRIWGGTGDDRITVTGAADTMIDAGGGDDFVLIETTARSAEHVQNVTLGSGRDALLLVADVDATSTARAGTVVTDFSVAEGDQVDLTVLVSGVTESDGSTTPTLIGYLGGYDPFGAGYLKLVQSGDDTLLQVDKDATGGAFAPVTFMTFADTDATSFTGDSFQLFPFDLGRPVPINPAASFGILLEGSDSDDRLSGRFLGDGIDGGAGDDTIHGLDGSDSLFGGDGDDRLVGGAGDDVLNGGSGDDTYIVDQSGDRIFELDDAGTDTVSTSVSLDLRSQFNVENVVVRGDAAVTIDGNFSDNVITLGRGGGTVTAGYGNDVVRGSAVADVFLGFDGDGDDVMSGGGAGDTFVFDDGALATGADRITDLGMDDVLLFRSALVDPDGDGIVALGAGGTLTRNADAQLTLDNVEALRFTGMIDRDGVSYAGYQATDARAGVSPIAPGAFLQHDEMSFPRSADFTFGANRAWSNDLLHLF